MHQKLKHKWNKPESCDAVHQNIFIGFFYVQRGFSFLLLYNTFSLSHLLFATAHKYILLGDIHELAVHGCGMLQHVVLIH